MFEEKTQLFEEIFPNCTEDKIKEILEKLNITIPDNFRFSNKMNIVIGSNGSGKTRLLKAIKELYQQDPSIRVMYGYYPSIPDVHIDNLNGELPDYSLGDFLRNRNASFNDLLNFIAQYGPEFISDLVNYRSRSEKEENSKILDDISRDFFILTGKKLIGDKRKIYVEDKQGNKMVIEEALSLFSPGETMLLYMSIFLSMQKNNKEEKSVIILDEPESHLHPKALLDFIDMLQTNHKSETIWIATHSLFAIPQLKFENIIYIKDNIIEKRRSTIYNDLKLCLLGDETEPVEMFFSSLSQWQYCEFIAECLTNPEVIDTVNADDEQVQIFVQFLSWYRDNNIELNILDFGGGSARLGLSLNLIKNEDKPQYEYEIYDPKPQYEGEEFKVYTKLEEIKKKYDCIVMMNVLHEIKPTDWLENFRAISSLLKDNGYLVFVEVSALTSGEMPNDFGYFVLGEEELKVLCNANEGIPKVRIKNNQKSLCFILDKFMLSEITQNSIDRTINRLKEHSMEEIKQIKNVVEKGKKAGVINTNSYSRRYAFWTQQYVNAKIYSDTIVALNINNEIKDAIQKKKNQDEKYNQVIKLLNSPEIKDANSIIIKSIRDKLITSAERILLNADYNNAKPLNDYWKDIITLEAIHYNKTIIAIFLFVGSIIGDKRCENRYVNNDYERYLNIKKYF